MFTTKEAGYAWLACQAGWDLPPSWAGAFYVLATDEGWNPQTTPELDRLAEIAEDIDAAIRTGVPYRVYQRT